MGTELNTGHDGLWQCAKSMHVAGQRANGLLAESWNTLQLAWLPAVELHLC